MKIGVISDTHGLVRPEVYEVFDGVDLILHAGDIGSQDVIIELEAIAPVKAVAGNVDFELRGKFKDKMNFALDGRAFHLQHIFDAIPEEADHGGESVADVIVFGHSHRALNRQAGKTLYFNPGSAGPRRFNLPVTVGLLTLNEKTIAGEVVELRVAAKQ